MLDSEIENVVSALNVNKEKSNPKGSSRFGAVLPTFLNISMKNFDGGVQRAHSEVHFLMCKM